MVVCYALTGGVTQLVMLSEVRGNSSSGQQQYIASDRISKIHLTLSLTHVCYQRCANYCARGDNASYVPLLLLLLLFARTSLVK